jgi:hypothetical protein
MSATLIYFPLNYFLLIYFLLIYFPLIYFRLIYLRLIYLRLIYFLLSSPHCKPQIVFRQITAVKWERVLLISLLSYVLYTQTVYFPFLFLLI